ncbi:MAG: hypothetical protein IPG31_00920 [Nitrosomonas sp.]|nr:hypothetical protein [Nitrosomonas sp.]
MRNYAELARATPAAADASNARKRVHVTAKTLKRGLVRLHLTDSPIRHAASAT